MCCRSALLAALLIFWHSLVLISTSGTTAVAGDWPMNRADAARSGYTADALSAPLGLRWVFTPKLPPQPAWPRLKRMPFDRAFHVVVADGHAFFGSSVDGIVRALDVETGGTRWTFVTDAPIRFAPAAFDHRVYVASDDGFLYCLDAIDGRLIWKKRGGPSGEMVLGNGHMISSWPARGGPAIRDGIVYFAAGIWPTHGIYLHAVDAQSGETIWMNDSAGNIVMPQPHPTAEAESGVSAQGYLVVSDDTVLVPTGRAVPAAFDRADGRFLYYQLQQEQRRGGTTTMLTGRVFYNNGSLYDVKTGMPYGRIGPGAMAQRPGGFVHATQDGLVVCQWTEREKTDDAGKTQTTHALETEMKLDTVRDDRAMIVAGEHAIVGGQGVVRAVDLASKTETWSANVDGRVYGLAAADGRLFVSTDTGSIYCFDGNFEDEPMVPAIEKQEFPDGDHSNVAFVAKTVSGEEPVRILGEEAFDWSTIREGYCVDLGCGNGDLALELAKRTNLTIIAVEDDPALVAEAREKLIAAGLYGSRVTVLERALDATGLPKFFANLVVSQRSCSHGAKAVDWDEAKRLQRPYGGVIFIGEPASQEIDRRGPLENAGQWTHQYANPANTVCSGDAVRGPLRPLWFRDVGQVMTQRHGRGPAPLFHQGRLFSEGLDSLIAVDAYNGRKIWEVSLPGILKAYDGDHLMGTAGSQSNYCVSDTGVYIRVVDRCLRLDTATGKEIGNFPMPPLPEKSQADPYREKRWGFVATADGQLFGTRADMRHVVTYRYKNGGDLTEQLTESDTLFALDAMLGESKWHYVAKHSIRHNAIAIGGGRVYLIDRPPAAFDRQRKKPKDATPQPLGSLVALDAESGEIIWQTDEDVFGTLLALSEETGSLLVCYQPTRFRLASEVGGRLAVYDAATGKRRWEKEAKYDSRPIINGQIVYAQGGAWDVVTGEPRPFDFRRSYGCGILAAGRNMLVFRSATLGYFDFASQDKVQNFGGMRPGCWINAIPAGGLVLVPDGTAGCVCSYQNRTWLALQGAD